MNNEFCRDCKYFNGLSCDFKTTPKYDVSNIPFCFFKIPIESKTTNNMINGVRI